MIKPTTRRGCISAFLGLIILVNFLAAVYFILGMTGVLGQTQYSQQVMLYSILVCLGNTVCAIGAWYWRKWGLVGYGILAIVSYLSNAIMTGSFTNLIGLAGSSILVTLFLPFWKDMK